MKYLIILGLMLYSPTAKADNILKVDCTKEAAKVILLVAYLDGCAQSNKTSSECMALAKAYVQYATEPDKDLDK